MLGRSAPEQESRLRSRRAGLALAVIATTFAGGPTAVAATSLPPVVGPDGGYPEGRAPELITPSDKNLGTASGVLPIPNGGSDDAIGFGISAGLPDSRGFQVENTLVGRRTSSGWQLTDATIPSLGNRESSSGGANAQGVQVNAYSADLRSMLLTGDAPLTEGDTVRSSLDTFRFSPDAGLVERLSTPDASAPPPAAFTTGVQTVGASEDLSSVVIASNPDTPLAAGAATNSTTLYRRDRGGSLEIVSLMPDGSVAGSAPTPIPAQISAVGNKTRGYGVFGSSQQTFVPNGGARGVSADGTRVLFNYSLFDLDTFQNVGGLYMRDGDDRTLAVSRSRRAGDADASKIASAVGMSRDGGTVYFVSDEPLTDEDGGGLFRYRVDGDQLDRLIPAQLQGGSSISSAVVSADASTVYFVSSAALAPGGEDGRSNAYVWSASGVRHLATWDGPGTIARVSRDGRFGAITSTASIDNATNDGREALYVVRRDGGAVACASCRADGTPNAGDASLDAQGPRSLYGEIAPRNITDDGQLFFTTTDSLVPGDTSDDRDVYEFDGTQPRLLSAGTGGASYVAENSDDGRTVFVSTVQRLAPQDGDVGEADLYALRVGGGFPFTEPDVSACSGEQCRPGTGTPPATPAPRSTADVPTTEGRKDGVVPAGGRVQVTKSSANRRSVKLTVRVPTAGVLRVAGSRIRTTTRRTTRAASYTVTATLTASARRTLARSGRLRVKASVRFVPASGKSLTASKTLTVRSERSGRTSTERGAQPRRTTVGAPR